MNDKTVLKSGGISVELRAGDGRVESVSFSIGGKNVKMLISDSEFVSSVISCDGKPTLTENGVAIKTDNEYFSATSDIRLEKNVFSRRQTYIVKKEFRGFFNPHFICCDSGAKYTYPIRVYDKPITEVKPLRNDYLWALPLPAHLWHGNGYAAAYCIDRQSGVGTCDFENINGNPHLGVYYPDRNEQSDCIMPFSETKLPDKKLFTVGETVKFTEYIAYSELKGGEHALLACENLAADMLLTRRRSHADYAAVADKIADYYKHNGLWDPDALGKGKGWYRNMWKHTKGGVPEKDFHYDLGWGEGYGVITLSALARYSLRTGDNRFSEQIEQLTDNISEFLRDKNVKGAYFDRFLPSGMPSLLGQYKPYNLCDFLGIRRIWTHSLAMIGYQLADLYEDTVGHYESLRRTWIGTATDIADFLISEQKPNGDINDGFADDNSESNKKRHRIPARAVACGLFARLYSVTGDEKYIKAGLSLSSAVAPEIKEYMFYNQMLDAHVDIVNGQIVESGSDSDSEIYDGENACYAFAGLTDLYGATRDKNVLALCENCAAYLIGWMYFYDVPTGVNGRTRGATTCRMPDTPLVYIGAGNFCYTALVKFSSLTGNVLYENIAKEMFDCAADYGLDAKGKPWDGGIVHAVYQIDGRHWGPNIEGQMDTGMTSGSTLVNIEKYLQGKL